MKSRTENLPMTEQENVGTSETASGESRPTAAHTGVRERPILFSGEMVRALLDGRKTQTRRVVTPQPVRGESGSHFGWETPGWPRRAGSVALVWPEGPGFPVTMHTHCPYGVVGDRLWVRETFTLAVDPDESPSEGEDAEPHAIYRAEWGEDRTDWPVVTDGRDFHWTPSIFMRREYSRITLEITGVRVERVQDISEADAIAEGSARFHGVQRGRAVHHSARLAYSGLWNSLNADRGYSWESNPWVWCLTFRVVRP